MTITVTVEELKAHEKAVKEYYASAVTSVQEKRVGPFGDELRFSPNQYNQFLKDNPSPKLIPNV